MKRSIRIEAVEFLLPFLAVSGFFLFSRGIPWRHEWAWALDWASGSTLILGPLVSSATAWVVARWHGVRQLMMSTPRGWAFDLMLTVRVIALAWLALTAVLLRACR